MATILADRWCDSSTARTTRTACESPSQNFCTPATIAAAAERWPPPVSEEMIKIFGPCDRDMSFVRERQGRPGALPDGGIEGRWPLDGGGFTAPRGAPGRVASLSHTAYSSNLRL